MISRRSFWIWIGYCLISVAYFASFRCIDVSICKIIFCVAGVCVLANACIEIYKVINGDVNKYELRNVLMTVATIGFNTLFIAVYTAFGMPDYKWKIVSFVVVQLITAFCVLHSGTKRGLFKDGTTLP